MWLSPCTGRCGAPIRASSSVMMICSFKVAPMPPYCFGQCGAIQPLRERIWYQGISSAGGGRVVRSRSDAGRLASSQLRTSVRNVASAGVSRRNMLKSFHRDLGVLDHLGPQRQLFRQHRAEVVRRADLDVGAERGEPVADLRRVEAVAERLVELGD